MNGIGQKVVQGTKATAQQTAQAIAKQVRDETLETARAAKQQIAPIEAARPPEYNRQQSVSQMAQETAQAGYNPEAHKAEADAKLMQLRARITQMQQEEVQRAQQQGREQQQEWQRIQEEKMQLAERPTPEGPISPMGKVKKAMGGAMKGMKAKLSSMQKGGEARASRSKD